MVNEEDHLRVQFMLSGFRLPEVWDAVNKLDDKLEEQLAFAFSPQLGYLTACPTNVGTGIRVGVMLHLPGLVHNKRIDKVFRALQKINLAVRGLYGEGSQASGDFYQISNQQTLGKSEPELIKILTDVVPQVLQYERAARQDLLTQRRQHLHDQVSRAYGVLKTAQTITSEETMLLLSQRADGDQPGADRRPFDRDCQRAVHPDAAGLPAEAARQRAGRRGTQRGSCIVPAQQALQRASATASLE